MTEEIAAVGDIATGAVLARAVEPHAGGTHGHGMAHGLCLNCGTALIGDYCHACGQSEHVHRTLPSIAHDLLHGVFHFEGKIWRTLPMLVLHPGELTRRYVTGERARFVSPIALFLFAVFLMFAVVANLPGWHLGDGASGDVQGRVDDVRTRLGEERVKAEGDLARTMRALAEARAAGDARAIARSERRVADATTARDDLTRAQTILGGDPRGGTAEPAAAARSAPTDWLDAKYREAKQNPQLLIYKLKTSAYKFSWALIPISLPFIWLLFPWRRDVGLYDHAVFATYSLTFMTGLVVVLSLLSVIGTPGRLLTWAALLAPPVHMFAQLRGAYGLGKRSALWRTIVLVTFATIALGTFAILLLVLGVSG